MMRKRLLNQQNLTRRLGWLFLLFALLQMPIGAWADYELAIQYGTEESNYHSIAVPENTTDVLGDGTITYDSNTHVLTLNGANVTCSYNSYSFIVNNGYWDAEQELTVRLVGSNTITLGNGSSFYDGKGITFVTGEGNDGSLTIVKESGWNGILFKDGSTEITPTCKDGLTYNSSTSEITLAEDHYSLWICGTQVTDANKDDILGDGKWSYVHYSGSWLVMELTLHGVSIENYSGNVISTGSRLTVKIDQGSTNTISCADGYYPFYSDNESLIYFDAYLDGTITGTNRKPFSYNCDYFFETNNVTQGPTLYFTQNGYTIAPGTNQWDVRINGSYLYDENHADVFGDGSVNVAEADNGNTVNFTLNNANFRGPITTEEYENVVVDLTGVNYIRVIDSPDIRAFHRSYDGSYNVTFTGNGELRIIDKYITSADDPFTSHEYSSSNTYDASANFTTGGWLKEYVTPTDGSDPYLRIYIAQTPTTYDLIVAGIPVTSANAANVLDFVNENQEPAVVFDASTNTLTLNDFYIAYDLSEDLDFDVPFIQNGLENLTIHLVGSSTLFGSTYFLGKSGDGNKTVTFTTDTENPGSVEAYCTNQTLWNSGQTLKWQNGLGWRFDGDSDYGSSIYITTDHGLSVGNVILCDNEGVAFNDGPWGNSVSFDEDTNTLTLNNATINGNVVVKNNVLSTLNIKVKGQNVINAGSQSAIKANIQPDAPYDNIVLSFAKDGEGDCSLQLNSDNVTVISGGFDDDQLTYTDLALVVEDKNLNPSYYSNVGLCHYADPNFYPITSATITSYTTYGITVNGIAVTSLNMNSILEGSLEQGQISFDGDHTLTLSDGASVGQITYSGTSNLTIAFSGTCSITTEETSAIQYTGSESDRPKLTFSLTNETGSLSINGESFVIKGFSDVDFGNLNLASTYTQGVYYDTDDFLMRSHDTPPRDLTITTETYYPIWIFDPSLSNTGYSHTQLNGESTIEIGDGTVSFDGHHTITISNINFHYEGNTLIVVGPSMTELTVNLDGESTATDCSVLSLWDTTPLTFTTSESDPGSLTGNDIVSWNMFGNGQIAYQNGLKVFYDVENSYKKTISTTGTYIKIGDTEVSATGDITTAGGTAHFDASSNTLTLTGATIGEQGAAASTDIQVLVDDLIIEISGTNTTYGIISYNGSNYQSSNIQINKASNVESASLKVTNVEGFTSCTWGDGLYLSAQDAQGATIDVHYEHYEGEGGSMQSYYGEGIADVIFSTTGTNAIWVAGNMSTGGDITGTGIEGTVTYNANDRILTIENAYISTNDNYPSPLIVCNGDLTVNLVGRDNNVYFNGYYGTYIFKNNASTGTLTFTGTGSFSLNTDFSEGTYIGLCDGFSTVDFGDLTYTINGDTKSISPLNISTPMMNVFEGKIEFITDGYLFGSTTYYKIVYADGSGNGEEVPLTNSDWSNYNEKITISELTGPCTVYAYTKYNDETGNSAKAKLFSPAEEIQRIVYGETASLAIAPAIEDGDGIKISGIEANNLNYDSETGKVTGTAIGSTSFPVPLSYTSESGEYMPGNTIILNSENFYMDVEIVPPAPTISLEAGTYLSTHDPITITRTGLDNTTNTTIKYKWDDGTAQTYEEAIPVQNGTLTAWVEYSDGTTTVSSEEVTAEYTVKTDIAILYVAPIADIAYTGSAVTPPTIVVKASEEAEASLVAGTDYTVSYMQGETAIDADDIVALGTYTAVITGIGNYIGTAEVTFKIKRQLDITFSTNNSWTTYYATESLTVPEGLEAYSVTDITPSQVVAGKVKYIPANTAVLLKVAEGANPASLYMAEAYTGTETGIGTNLLQGTSTEMAVSSITSTPVFVLYKDQFVKTTTGSIPAHRGYLVVDPSTLSEPSSRALTIVIGDEATRVTGPAIANEDDRYYDLQGRRVNKVDVKKGLYIRNGKKTYIK